MRVFNFKEFYAGMQKGFIKSNKTAFRLSGYVK